MGFSEANRDSSKANLDPLMANLDTQKVYLDPLIATSHFEQANFYPHALEANLQPQETNLQPSDAKSCPLIPTF